MSGRKCLCLIINFLSSCGFEQLRNYRIKLDIGGVTKTHYDILIFDGKPTKLYRITVMQ